MGCTLNDSFKEVIPESEDIISKLDFSATAMRELLNNYLLWPSPSVSTVSEFIIQDCRHFLIFPGVLGGIYKKILFIDIVFVYEFFLVIRVISRKLCCLVHEPYFPSKEWPRSLEWASNKNWSYRIGCFIRSHVEFVCIVTYQKIKNY